MKAIVIDPQKQELRDIEISGDKLQAYYETIGCSTVTAVNAQFMVNGEIIQATIWVDDEGLFVEDQSYWFSNQYPYPLAGRGILVGFEAETGDCIDAPVCAEDFKRDCSVTFLAQ